MPKKYQVKEFYKPEEITPAVLMGAIDEREPRLKPMMRYVEAVAHDGELIEVKILVQQRERFASIQGFSDSSILVRGMKTDSKRISPFHIKNAREFKATEDDGFLVPTGNGSKDFALTQDGIVDGTDELESMRMNLQFWGIAAMLNDKQFTYQDGDKVITVSYEEEVGDLTNPGTALNDPGCDQYYETDIMAAEYYSNTGQRPTLAFVNGTTAAKLKQQYKVQRGLTPQQPSDPDPSGDTFFEGFVFNGILFLPIHDLYPDLDGATKKAVDDGYALVTVPNDERGGGAPIKIHRAANILNRGDSSRAFYDSWVISEDPFAMGLRLYDNMIPGVSRKNIVMKWKMW